MTKAAVTDVIVLGGGAAGLMCAAVAAGQGKSVVLLEGNAVLGKKIRISGGGRCNFTNIGTTHKQFVSENPDFCRSALARYTPQDFIELVESYDIAWHEKKLGQLFCDGSSQQIIDMLVAECRRHGAEIVTRCHIHSVTRSDVFTVETDGAPYTARAVVVATGGLSIPTIGATDIGCRIARHFDHKVIPMAPALVPLTFDGAFASTFGALSGISLDASVTAGEATFRENILFTHRGLSGPSILQASTYWRKGQELTLDTMPDHDVADLLSDPAHIRRQVSTVLGMHLPQRFVDMLDLPQATQAIANVPRKDLQHIVHMVKSWSVVPTGTEGYAKAEVTRGGVDTAALSQKTMESRTVPGLYFIGEVVDVTGWLGGYNFQWAWASAHAAGMADSR